jgi:hypothetical protein
MAIFVCANKKCDSAQRRHGMKPCFALSQHEEVPPCECMHGLYAGNDCPYLLVDASCEVFREITVEIKEHLKEEMK